MTEKTKISLLIIEDTEDDAVLLLRELDRGGFDVTHRRVDRIADIEASIAPGHGWDVIVSDHNLPGFTGVDALGIVRERDAETPFIFVSGTMGEETAVAAVRAGAQDFLVKGKIGRLPTIVTRELRDARTRREQRTVDEKLRQLSRAVEQSANFVVILDRAGQVEYVNPSFCEATGYSAADVSGRRPVFWSLAPDLEATIWESVLSGADWRGEVDNIAHDGRRLSVSATVSPVTNDDGDITHVIVIEEDITRRREIEAQLRQAQKMEAVGNLTGGMAHDFNNLLAVIIGNLDLLCEMQKDNEELQELAREALEAAMSGADLTRRLLAFARREPLDPQVVDVNQIAGSTVRLLRRMLDPMIGVSFSPGGDLWPVVVDPAQLASSITNLATNARDAMPGGGRFELRTSNQTVDGADFVVIEARDTGSGMPPEVLAHIFEPFYTTKEQGKGSGLGLSMVFGFIKQSGGRISVESKVNAGTLFRIFLPRNDGSALASPDQAAMRPVAKPGRRSVLVVEGRPELLRIAMRQLAELGYRVFPAETAAAALAVMGREAVDILITDLALGDSSGLDLARTVSEQWPATRIVFTSGFPEGIGKAPSPVPGARFLPKPYRKDDLARVLGEALAA